MADTKNLMLIRLSTNEEIMGEVTSNSGQVMTVKNPVRVVVVPSKTDPSNPSVAFAPFLQWSDDKELTLNANHVIVTATPISEFVNQYNSMFGGLVVPKTGLIKP